MIFFVIDSHYLIDREAKTKIRAITTRDIRKSIELVRGLQAHAL